MDLPRRLSDPGPIIEYIANLERMKSKDARLLVASIRKLLLSPEGLILLKLLDKAILERSVSTSADPRALDALNAQSFIALDLRRILSDEFDDKSDKVPKGNGGTS